MTWFGWKRFLFRQIIALFVMGDQLLLCDWGGMSKLGENQGEASELLRPARAGPARQSCCGSLLGVLTSRNIAGAMGWTGVHEKWPSWSLNPLNCARSCISKAKAVQRRARMHKNMVLVLCGVPKAGWRLCTQADLCSSSASPDDLWF